MPPKNPEDDANPKSKGNEMPEYEPGERPVYDDSWGDGPETGEEPLSDAEDVEDVPRLPPECFEDNDAPPEESASEPPKPRPEADTVIPTVRANTPSLVGKNVDEAVSFFANGDETPEQLAALAKFASDEPAPEREASSHPKWRDFDLKLGAVLFTLIAVILVGGLTAIFQFHQPIQTNKVTVVKETIVKEEPVLVDADGDGFSVESDCNDEDATVHLFTYGPWDSADYNCAELGPVLHKNLKEAEPTPEEARVAKVQEKKTKLRAAALKFKDENPDAWAAITAMAANQ